MPKEEWGVKRVCPTTGKRFYDLGRSPVVSPYTGEVVDIESARRKAAGAIVAMEAKKSPVAADEELDADDLIEGVADDADLDDELLEDDEDETVSLDDLADVPGGEDEL
jgi:uncharacterized protein (TIGR02300 family)